MSHSGNVEKSEKEEQRWRAIFQALPACVSITHGPNHIFQFVNEAYLKSSNSKDVVGKSLAEAHPDLQRQGILDLADKIFREGKIYSNIELPAEVDLSDGSKLTRYFSGTITPLKNEKGEVEGLINFQYDVTDFVEHRRQLLKTKEQLNIAVEAGNLVLWEWSPTQGLTWGSDNLSSIFGLPKMPEDWSFERFIQCLHPDDREGLVTHYAEHLQSNSPRYKYEYRVVWPDGSIHWINSQGQTVRDENGNVERMVGALFDITEQKESELLQKLSKEAAEAANIAKTQFLANMSHEIRTPLAAIMGFASLLTNPKLSDEKRINFAEAIERNGKALVKIIDDVLDISKVESGLVQINKVPFDLSDLLKEIKQLCELKVAAKKIQLSFSQDHNLPTVVNTDPHRLRQVILNIVANAIKFTDQGTIDVDIRIDKPQSASANSTLLITVRDTGVGISAEFQKNLFKPFSQADGSAARHFGGAGLGLAISRKLARALDGDVTLVWSSPGRGSEFRIEIPVAPLSVPEIASNSGLPAIPTSRRLSGKNILLAEDTPDLQELISIYLEKEGAKVEIVGSGYEMVGVPLEDFDIALVDLQMPGMDGYTLARNLKDSGSQIPLVAVTAHALTYEKEKCLSAGFSDYLTKPLNFEQLTQTILDLS